MSTVAEEKPKLTDGELYAAINAADEKGAFCPAVPVACIVPSETNPRKHFDEAALKELAASISSHGLIQPIVLRFKRWAENDHGVELELITGERRWRAARIAKVKTLPAVIRQLQTRDILEIQTIENLQRADVHPLDEALGYGRLIADHGYTVDTIAAKIGKPPSYVHQRMKLADLTQTLQDKLWKDGIPLAHALFLCRFNAADQTALEKRIFNWNDSIVSMKDLRVIAERELLVNLDRARWKIDDAELLPKAGACKVCPKRSGCNPTLFTDLLQHPNTCTDRTCFDEKMEAFIDRLAAQKPELVLVTSYYSDPKTKNRALDHGQYFNIRNKSDKCDKQENAIAIDGAEAGQIIPICRTKDCKKHSAYVSTRNAGGSQDYAAKQREDERRYRVECAARAVMMKALLAGKPTKLTSADLRDIAIQIWERMGYDDQTAFGKALGWEKEKLKHRGGSTESFSPVAKRAIAEAKDTGLIRLLLLMTVSGDLKPFIYSDWKSKTPDRIIALGKRWGIDTVKVGAAVRDELNTKHKARLSGQKAKVKAEKKAAPKNKVAK